MRAKIFILSLLIINAYSISNERVSNYHKQGIKKFLVFDNEYENRPTGNIFHTLNNRTDNRTHPTPHNRTDPYPKPDNRTDNKSNIDLVSINTNAVEYSILAEDFLLVFKNADTNPRLIHSITIKKFSDDEAFKFPLYCYKIENIYLASCLGDVKRIESDIYFVTGIEYGNELINLNKSLTFYIRKSSEDQRRNHSINF